MTDPSAPTPPARLIVGCGYLGRRVATRWVAEGGTVFALTRGRADDLRRLGVYPILGDVLGPDSLHGLPTVQTVLYAVGLDRSAGHAMREVYVRGLANVLAALPIPGRFLYVSSTSVYGHQAGEEIDETAATEPLEESGQVVLEAERLLRARLPGAVVLRFAGIYGPDRLLRRKAIEAGEPLVGDADKWLNLIHVDDGAEAVRAAELRAEPGATYHVSDGHPVRRRDFYTRLAELLSAPPARFAAPPADQPPPSHERANQRIRNARLRQELGVSLHYPHYELGLPAALSASRLRGAG